MDSMQDKTKKKVGEVFLYLLVIVAIFAIAMQLAYIFKPVRRLECEFLKKESISDTLAGCWTGEYKAISKFVFIGLDLTNTARLDSEEKTIDGFIFMEVTKDSITKQFTRNEFLSKIGFDTTASK